jgi:hypothetical protein
MTQLSPREICFVGIGASQALVKLDELFANLLLDKNIDFDIVKQAAIDAVTDLANQSNNRYQEHLQFMKNRELRTNNLAASFSAQQQQEESL